VFVNAPAGIEYPTDQGFPAGRAGFNRQWLNFSPRAGVAWDVFGTGRLAVRSSYALAPNRTETSLETPGSCMVTP